MIPPHSCYVEAFAGGLALLLAKPRSKCEIVNDINEDLVKLYRCVQWHMDALIAEFEWCLSSRLVLNDFRRQPGLTDIPRAARFLAINRTSFAGIEGKFLLTVDDSPFNRRVFAPFPFTAHSTRNLLRKQSGPSTYFGELIFQSHPQATRLAA